MMATHRHATILPPAPARVAGPLWLLRVPEALLVLAVLAALACCAALLSACGIGPDVGEIMGERPSLCSDPMPTVCIFHFDDKQRRSVDYCQAGAGPAGDGGTRPRAPSLLMARRGFVRVDVGAEVDS